MQYLSDKSGMDRNLMSVGAGISTGGAALGVGAGVAGLAGAAAGTAGAQVAMHAARGLYRPVVNKAIQLGVRYGKPVAKETAKQLGW